MVHKHSCKSTQCTSTSTVFRFTNPPMSHIFHSWEVERGGVESQTWVQTGSNTSGLGHNRHNAILSHCNAGAQVQRSVLQGGVVVR